MSAVLITGSAGAGKSAIAAVLARRGLACIDDDEDPFLARFVASDGAAVAEEPEQPDYPKDNPVFQQKFGPRGVLECKATERDDPTVDPRRLAEFGCAGYLPKPFALETLVDTMERLIEGDVTQP